MSTRTSLRPAERRTLGVLTLLLVLLTRPVEGQTRLTPLSAAGHSLGSAAGLVGGVVAGGWASGRFNWDCCGDDPGLGARLTGAAIGSVLGTAVGGEIAVRASGERSAGFGQRIIGSMAGMLGGIALAALVDKVAEHGSPGIWIATYSLGQGVTTALLTQARPSDE